VYFCSTVAATLRRRAPQDRSTQPTSSNMASMADADANDHRPGVRHGPSTPRPRPPTRTHNGRDYWFCGQGCADAFDREPERFSGTTSPQGVTSGTSPMALDPYRNMISGMGFYREQVLPRIQDKVMGRKPNRAIRDRVCAGLAT